MKRLLCVLPFLAAMLCAQQRGTISGAVTDPSGSPIPKAAVTATEIRTGVKTTAVSENSGAYNMPFLPIGQYTISAEAAGFKKYVQQGITLSAGEHPVIDIHMSLGEVSQSVTVNSDAPLLVTANPSLGQVITGKEVEDFPINGRTPMMLDNLAMGVISTYEPGPVRPFDNGAPNSISVAGAPSSRNEVLMDGSPNAGQSNQMAYSPPQDSVSEVRVDVSDMDASQGHTMGGTVNVVTKSGTNSLHGAAYIFNQTSRFDANTFFNNAKGVPRPPYHQNQYGVNGGGPVVIPKLFNGRNKVFWFFAWEGMRDSDPANSPVETGNPENFTSVPTEAERKGDFSQLLNAGTNYQIYDPSTGVLQGNLVSRLPFPNNVIPTNRLDPVALKYLPYFPLPNTAGNLDGSQNYVVNAVDSDGYDNELGRMDVNVSDRNRLSFNARHNFRAQNKNNFFGNEATGNYLYRINQGFGLEDVYTLTPTTILDLHGNWTRYIENHASPSDSIDPLSLGFPDYIAQKAEFLMLPYVSFGSNGTGVSGGSRAGYEPLGYTGDAQNFSDIFSIAAQVDKIHGNHSLKFGVDGRMYRWSAFSFGSPSGTYSFKSDWTNNPAVSKTPAPMGQDMAAFLLGLPSSGSLDVNSHSTVQADYLAFYVNDDWRAKSNLTLSFGLRWDHDFPEVERFNRSVNNFDPTATNPISAAAAAAYAANPNAILPVSQFHTLGGLTFAGPGNRHVYSTQSDVFSPRLGFAWTPAALGKTTIRGGFGLFVDPIQLPSPYQYGFSQTTQMTITNDNFLAPVNVLSNPFPGGSILEPPGASLGTGTYLGQSISFTNPDLLNPYSIRWELSVQHELPGQMILETAYIGSHSIHMLVNPTQNAIPAQYLSSSPTRDNDVVDLLSGAVTNPFKGLLPNGGSLNGKTVALQQLLVPFPEFPINGITMRSDNAGSSYFQSLNVRLQKRFTNGLTFMNNFIWSKEMDRTVYLNSFDPLPTKEIGSNSRPFREVLAGTYQLPIGHGRALNLQSRVLDALVGGWQLSGILTLQSGPVLSWGNLLYYGGPLNYDSAQPNGTAFDISRFNTVSSEQLSDNIRTFHNYFNNLRRDATNQLDASLDKNFAFGEGRYLQIRFEAYNILNHVTFGNVNLSATNKAFGTIGSQANTPRRIESAIRLVF
ncbi:MAG TPA: carboxypeptidase regulatory-like domain-containing protein [Bryobacteraceae bacterium]|nr:carboxypeptidase regulatory-like domain-containing protein [Bryobacteraceae bacterium]